MAKQIKTFGRGPGLLYMIAVLVVVAVAGARFFGFSPGENQSPPGTGGTPGEMRRADPERVLPDPSQMTEVLVLHTHTSENYGPKDAFATRGPGDVLQVGKALVAALDAEGVGVVHVQTVHDLPQWNQAYTNARRSLQDALARHNGIRAVLDVHRDAVAEGQSPGFATATIAGEEVARILFVVGSTDNPLAQDNLRFAQALQGRLEQLAPGVTRGVRVMARETNQDVHPHAVIAYIGDHRDNTVAEAERAAALLAQALVEVLRTEG